MNTIDNIIQKIIIMMLGAVFLGIFLWTWRISVLEDKRKKEVSEIVQNVIKEQANKNLLLPKIIFINADSSTKKEFNNEFNNKISEVIINKYLTNDTTKFENVELKSFFLIPNKPNKKNTYILTDIQLNELKYHLSFLTKQVDIEVDKAKEEVGKDIDRLNNWITVWIGIIGFLGIFIPIIINIDVLKNVEKATEVSNTAITKIENAQPKIEKIEGIEIRVITSENKLVIIENMTQEAETKINEVRTQTDIVENKATNALDKSREIEKILTAIDAVGNFKDLDMYTLQYIKKPINLLIQKFKLIHSSLLSCNDQINHPIIKNCLRKLGVHSILLSTYKFMNRDNTEMINQFASIIDDKLNNHYCEQNFNDILNKLLELTDQLKEN
jgi:hypothetical protein